MNDPKVLIFDIETSPMLAYVWGRRDQNIGLNQIRDEWYVIAWAAKWLGDPPSKMMYMDGRGKKNLAKDRDLLVELWKLLDKADIVITQNGKNFDTPKLNARFILHGMNPPSPYKHLDTYQIVRRVSKFTSNKLEYLTDKLCIRYKKLIHSKFPGMSLWTECLAGNLKAWNEMERYNKHDVLATEELFLKIRAWAPTSMPSAYTAEKIAGRCGTCGVRGHINKRGIAHSKKGNFQKLQCQNCGSWSQGDKIHG